MSISSIVTKGIFWLCDTNPAQLPSLLCSLMGGHGVGCLESLSCLHIFVDSKKAVIFNNIMLRFRTLLSAGASQAPRLCAINDLGALKMTVQPMNGQSVVAGISWVVPGTVFFDYPRREVFVAAYTRRVAGCPRDMLHVQRTTWRVTPTVGPHLTL